VANILTLRASGPDIPAFEDAARDEALAALESGGVLYFPELRFDAEAVVQAFAPSARGSSRKNIMYDASTGRVAGAGGRAPDELVRSTLARYFEWTRALLAALVPRYSRPLIVGRTSMRPDEIHGRHVSWRKDDTRLHIDSFPSTPVHGKRILRVFSNVNAEGEPRYWRTGESFERVADRFVPRLGAPVPGSAPLLQWLGITKTRRTPYDHYMLRLHDAMKADLEYQEAVEQSPFDFPAGSTWIMFTDQVSHAAMKGRWAFEQTYYLPIDAMRTPSLSPLRTLERLMNRSLA
jgi:hypothetical protein